MARTTERAVAVPGEFERAVCAGLDDHPGLDRPEREVLTAGRLMMTPDARWGPPSASRSRLASDTSTGRDSVVDTPTARIRLPGRPGRAPALSRCRPGRAAGRAEHQGVGVGEVADFDPSAAAAAECVAAGQRLRDSPFTADGRLLGADPLPALDEVEDRDHQQHAGVARADDRGEPLSPARQRPQPQVTAAGTEQVERHVDRADTLGTTSCRTVADGREVQPALAIRAQLAIEHHPAERVRRLQGFGESIGRASNARRPGCGLAAELVSDVEFWGAVRL
ncbi:hypothetical protein I6J71_12480 [Amycolatopsis sp. FDAARGOS 1241]|nr:hypothetical protein [Amycolatopsis sp. FDAARGOS 1241]QRP48578.1 hypothetical protein I6J71_12480 [Amycolatopsis sp. FDAARGOS 1241]